MKYNFSQKFCAPNLLVIGYDANYCNNSRHDIKRNN